MSTLETLLKNSLFWELSDAVDKLREKYLDDIGINYFDYARFYKDGKFFILFNDKEYFKFVLNAARGRGHKVYKPPTDYLNSGKHLWQSYIDHNFLYAASNSFNHYNGMTIIKHRAEYNEVMNFSAPKTNTDVIDIYLAYDFILNIFGAAISEKFEKIINNHKYHLQLPADLMQTKSFFDKKKIENFLAKIKTHFKTRKDQILLPSPSGVVAVSKNELACLELILSGLSNKEIARKMKISDRTVEIYCTKLLKKTNSSSRLQLISDYPISTVSNLKKFI